MNINNTLPDNDTVSLNILELIAISGEFPTKLIDRIAGGSSYKQSVVTALKRQKFVRTYPQKPDYLPSIEGIIIYNHNTNAYWEEGAEFDMNASPMCSSPDGKTGYGDPGGACATCPYNQYDTDPNGGRGKACKNMRSLYILQHDKLMPINLLLPPTSLKEYSNFVQNAFIMRKRPLWGSLVHIELRKVANGSNNYAVAVFTRVGDFTGEKLAEIKEYAIGARAAIKEMLEQRAINTENRNEPLDAITEVIDETDEGGEPFNAANAIGDGSITA